MTQLFEKYIYHIFVRMICCSIQKKVGMEISVYTLILELVENEPIDLLHKYCKSLIRQLSTDNNILY